METIKSFLCKIDIFGVPYSFKYKSEDKYTTPLGGLVVLLFVVASLTLGIYYFIPFYNRKNFTTVYYTLTTPQADRISFAETKAAFSFGLNCWTGKDGTTADQLFNVDFKYIYWQYVNNTYKRDIYTLGSHPCTKKDFYNEFNETFESSQIYNYLCLDDPSIPIEGIWTSEIFSYFQFEVNAKNESKELLKKIDDYLYSNDCKFQIYYSDNTIDIEDYNNPIKSYIEAIFIQINPTLSIRRNLYYMNQYLYDDNYLMSVFTDGEEVCTKKTLFSRYEEYSLFQGLTRQQNATDYLNYIKLFIRADTKKTEVKRRYQKINEFYADASALLITVYEILIIILELINNFWAQQSLSKKIFFFQDFDHKLHINDRKEKIQELLSTTNLRINNDKILRKKTYDANFIKYKNNKVDDLKNEKDIYPLKTKKYSSNNLNNFFVQSEETLVEIENGYQKLSNSYIGREIRITEKNNLDSNRQSRNNDICETNAFTDNNVITTNSSNKDKDSDSGEKSEEKIKYSYNLFDKIRGLIICKCCLSNKLKIKDDLTEKAMNLLDSKLDIALYVRNMMLIDIMNKILLDPETRDIVNFLTRPIISLKRDAEEKELSLFYHRYNEADFEKFYKEVIELSNKEVKQKEDIRLLSICNNHLKQIHI